jgi:maleate isomerase
VITPVDFSLDRELWRWVPENVTLHLTRLPVLAERITVGTARALADRPSLRQATRDVLTPEPAVVAYTCAAGSFVNGAAGDRRLCRAMLEAGAPAACTTSGALIDELRLLGVSRLAVVSPYSVWLTRHLVEYLAEHKIQTVATAGLARFVQRGGASPPDVLDRIRGIDWDDAEAVFICCTNVPTYDVLAPLGDVLGKPVLTANEVLMHAALRAVGAPVAR